MLFTRGAQTERAASRKLLIMAGVSAGVLMTATAASLPVRAQESGGQQGPLTLGPVRVEDDAERARRNALNKAPPISNMPAESLQDMPQAVNVVPQETMRAQATTTLGEALRNVPGITIAIGEGGQLAGDQFRIRGFDSKDDVYVDGLRDFAAYTRDSFNYEEIQVLKGPSGLMFGRGTTGGAINTVSKSPFLNNQGSVQIEGGNGEHVRGTADYNYQLSENAAFRVNAMYTNTGVVDRDMVFSHRWGIAPSFALGLNTDTLFTLSYIHQTSNNRQDYGIPVAVPPTTLTALPVSEYGVPRNTFLGFSTDRDRNTTDMVTAKISHTANDWLTISNDARVAIYSRYFQYTAVDRCDATAATNFCANVVTSANPTAALAGIGGQGPYQQDSWGLQDTVTANMKFQLGGLRNQLIAGVDVSYQSADRTIYAYQLPTTAQYNYTLGDRTRSRANIGRSLYNPDPNPPPGYIVVLPTPANVANTNTTATAIVNSQGTATDLAFFVTDRLWFTEAWSVIAGVRIDDYRAAFESTTVAGVAASLKSPSTIVNPRGSLVYEPSGQTTVYFSYGKSAVPLGTSVVGSPTPITAANQALDPEESETYELGVKNSFFDGAFGVTASIFQVNKANAVLTDPTSGNIVLQSGQRQRVRGFELSATGEVSEQLNILGAFTYLDAVITNDLTCGTAAPIVCRPNVLTIGKPINFVPKYAASIWADYKLDALAKGLSIGGGIVYQSRLFNGYAFNGTAPNLTSLQRIATIPETVQLDVVAAYQFDRYTLQLNVNNLTDRLNYAQSFGNRGTPAPGRTFILSVAAAF